MEPFLEQKRGLTGTNAQNLTANNSNIPKAADKLQNMSSGGSHLAGQPSDPTSRCDLPDLLNQLAKRSAMSDAMCELAFVVHFQPFDYNSDTGPYFTASILDKCNRKSETD